jgi:hypothetical protein
LIALMMPLVFDHGEHELRPILRTVPILEPENFVLTIFIVCFTLDARVDPDLHIPRLFCFGLGGQRLRPVLRMAPIDGGPTALCNDRIFCFFNRDLLLIYAHLFLPVSRSSGLNASDMD